MKALSRIDRQLEKALKDLKNLRRKRIVLARAESYKQSPEFRRLEHQHREVRARIHVIRVNIHKKKMSVSFKTRDIKNLLAAIQTFKTEEKQKVKELRAIESKINAFTRGRPIA